ncbi:MAG: hypothetical protein KGI90_02260 [Burkholderiales bacterium]|nr:hypothetical protein [Burkholderiales bacterium]
MIMNKILDQLNRDLARTQGSNDRAELLAKMACALARIGNFDDAKSIIRDLRVNYGTGQNGRITVWIMLAEGLINHYGELNPLAFDRINRAFVLSVAINYREMAAIAAAWKAHIEFETSKYDAICQSLSSAIDYADESNDYAHVRICAVLANCFMISGNRPQSQKYFLRGREHALRIGDQPSLEALVYNRAAFGLAWMRAENCLGRGNRKDASLLQMELQSAQNLQELTGINALSNHIFLWQARFLVLQERFPEAIEALSAVRLRGPFAAYNFSQSFIDLELAYCNMRLGNKAEMLALSSKIDPAFSLGLDIDDRLVAGWIFYQLSCVSDAFGSSTARELELKDLSVEYEGAKARLARQFEVFASY